VSDSSDRARYQAIAAGAGVLAIVAALATRGAPRWLRIILVAGLAGIACGAAALGYRHYQQPTTLSVSAGSIDGDAPRLMTAIAGKLAAANAPVRLKVVQKATAAEAADAFAKGETDLAVVRADVGDLSNARAVMIVARAVVLLIAPSGTGGIKDIDDLKGKTVGVVAASINKGVVDAISKEYDLERNKVRFRDLLPMEAPQALQGKQIQALLLVLPISETYIARIRDALLRVPKVKVALIPIESAGAIAAIHRAYESYDLPKGTIRGSPAVPDEDLTTLRLPLYLVAQKKLDSDVVGAVAKAVFDVRSDLVGEFPLLAQIAKPDTDKDAFVPVHPGAANYFDGEQKTFFDKYGDQLFYGSMLLGSLMSVLAAMWKFMTKKADAPAEPPLRRLYGLMSQVGEARSEADLANAEREIDGILKSQLERYPPGEVDAGEALALGLATHRLERQLEQRRRAIGARVGTAPSS
jgi:TRAP transporter TAXI family solute receptor